MSHNTRPIRFRDYLPVVFRTDEVNGVSFLSRFLQPFETLFEELEAAIEGTPGGDAGGIPDLFHPETTPPPQFLYRSQPDFEYLSYLAGWLVLPLRTNLVKRDGETEAEYATRRTEWNRQFFQAAIALHPKRSTLPGMEALLREWLKGDLLELDPPLLILTDLTSTTNDVDTVFQLAPENVANEQLGEIYAQLGLSTVLGEGPPFFFIADLIVDPAQTELHQPAGLDAVQQAARALLDAEKPAHTYYQLRLWAQTMQLAPENAGDQQPGEVYAQVGWTTMLWDAPWVFDSGG
jgi:hypothetical protein